MLMWKIITYCSQIQCASNLNFEERKGEDALGLILLFIFSVMWMFENVNSSRCQGQGFSPALWAPVLFCGDFYNNN